MKDRSWISKVNCGEIVTDIQCQLGEPKNIVLGGERSNVSVIATEMKG